MSGVRVTSQNAAALRCGRRIDALPVGGAVSWRPQRQYVLHAVEHCLWPYFNSIEYEFPCSPDEWNALRTKADTVLLAVDVPAEMDRDTANSTADASAAAETRACSNEISSDCAASDTDVDAQIGAGAPKRKPAHPVGDMPPTDMPVERKRVKGMSPTTSGQSDSPS